MNTTDDNNGVTNVNFMSHDNPLWNQDARSSVAEVK
jgi:hypothetical protein